MLFVIDCVQFNNGRFAQKIFKGNRIYGVIDIAVLLNQAHKSDNAGTFHIGLNLAFVVHPLHLALEYFDELVQPKELDIWVIGGAIVSPAVFVIAIIDGR